MELEVTDNGTVREYTAKEAIQCHACYILQQDPDFCKGLTFSEYRQIIKAKMANWKILPGEVCEEVYAIGWGLKPYIFYRKPEIHAICLKYGFYDNE